jgi:tetratricopeptide (TPR) repeat protein
MMIAPLDKYRISHKRVLNAVTRAVIVSLIGWNIAMVGGLAVASDVPNVSSIAQILESLRPDLSKVGSSESLKKATSALQLMADMKLAQASKAINAALQLDAQNTHLHFFNGLIYHLLAREGDTDKTGMAIEGYQQAIRTDPNNLLAHEFLGLAFVEQRQYVRAQAEFAEVLISKPTDLVTLQRMMAASYMSGDAVTACAMADQILGIKDRLSSLFLRASVSVYASCGAFDKSDAQRLNYSANGASPDELASLDQRIANWRAFHKSRNKLSSATETFDGSSLKKNVQFQQQPSPMGGAPFGGQPPMPGGDMGCPPQASPMGGSPFGAPQFGGSPFGAPQAGNQPMGGAPANGQTRMVLVDVVMIRTEDTTSTTKGINLLSALNLQFGSSSAPAYSSIFNQTSGTEGTTLLTRAISVPALAYSLNIANANSNLNEVLARPTLAALECLRSEFFSGTSLNAAVVSGGSGVSGSAVSIEKRYGVKLAVAPQILPGGMIKLTIDASRTFLKPPSSDIGFTYKLEISEITANANVVMRMGDTLILGGLSEKETTSNRDGTPMLQDIPGVQYLFSRQAKTDYQKSVLILITPRPATYTWLSDASKAEFAKKPDDPFTPSLDVLRARYSDWFKPYPNLASVFYHLNAADLYREFRTGDVTLETWDRMDSTRSRLKQSLGFLYY